MSDIHQRLEHTTAFTALTGAVRSAAPALRERFCACGGETRHARRLEGERLLTYLRCVFCGALTPLLEYDLATREHRSLLEEP